MNALLDELLGAYDRLQAEGQLLPAPQTGRRRRFRRRLFVVPALMLVTTATAAAAIVIGTHRSAPLSGALPRQILGSRYTLRVSPELQAGSAGWCMGIQIGKPNALATYNTSCVSPQEGPLITSGGFGMTSPTATGSTTMLLYAVVDSQVATLQAPEGTRILPIESHSLPPSWRAAVTVVKAPNLKPGSVDRGPVLALRPLDARGRLLPVPTREPIREPVSLPTRAVNPNDPPPRGCRIQLRDRRGVRLIAARTLRGALPMSLDVTSGLLSCYSLTFKLDGRVGTAALLLDAQHPGRRPAALPGTTPLRDHPGVWIESAIGPGMEGEYQSATLLAKRVGNAWLIVQTDAPADAAAALLKGFLAQM